MQPTTGRIRRAIGLGAAMMTFSGLVLAGVTTSATGATRGAATTQPPKILLALGDSLAAGYEPTFATSSPLVDQATGYRDQGYAGSYASDVATTRSMKLIDLGCPGETTASMLGTPAQSQCRTLYSAELGAHSQVAAAESFLARHQNQVGLLTLDIGANDVDACVAGTSLSAICVENHVDSAVKNLGVILADIGPALRRDDPSARIVSMNYYDPFLGLAFTPGGTKGTSIATASLAATELFNTDLARVYDANHVTVANVAAAFAIDAPLPVELYAGKRLPADVVTTCRLTWMCPTTAKIGPDIHPNLTGYRTIAGAFEKVLTA